MWFRSFRNTRDRATAKSFETRDQHRSMLRRLPTRVEMRLEDVDEFDRCLNQQQQKTGHEETKTTAPAPDVASRIGLRPVAERSESPAY